MNGLDCQTDFPSVPLRVFDSRIGAAILKRIERSLARSLYEPLVEYGFYFDSNQLYLPGYRSRHEIAAVCTVIGLPTVAQYERAANVRGFPIESGVHQPGTLSQPVQAPIYAIRSVAGNPLKVRGEINEDAFRSFGLLTQHRKSFSFLGSSLITGLSLNYSPVSYTARFIRIDRNQEGIYTGYTPTDSLLTDYTVGLVNLAGYTQLELAPVERLRLVAALRYDRMNYAFDNHLPLDSEVGGYLPPGGRSRQLRQLQHRVCPAPDHRVVPGGTGAYAPAGELRQLRSGRLMELCPQQRLP